MQSESELVGLYWPLLIAGEEEGFTALFAENPVIDDPIHGRFEGPEALREFLAAGAQWLQARHAEMRDLAFTRQGERVVHEGVLRLVDEGRTINLPVATVAELDGERLGWVRVYHSLWPLLGTHRVRPPLLAEDPTLRAPDVVGRYLSALAAGDVNGVVAAFETDGCAREPSGGPYLYCGETDLRRFYARLFSNRGGIRLEHCTITDDGVRCALEFNAVRWGTTDLPPQAGVAVYERGPTGRLAWARIYDDVDPPLAEESDGAR